MNGNVWPWIIRANILGYNRFYQLIKSKRFKRNRGGLSIHDRAIIFNYIVDYQKGYSLKKINSIIIHWSNESKSFVELICQGSREYFSACCPSNSARNTWAFSVMGFVGVTGLWSRCKCVRCGSLVRHITRPWTWDWVTRSGIASSSRFLHVWNFCFHLFLCAGFSFTSSLTHAMRAKRKERDGSPQHLSAQLYRLRWTRIFPRGATNIGSIPFLQIQ